MRATSRQPNRRLAPLRVLMWAAFASSMSMAAPETARADCRDVAQALSQAIGARDLEAVRGRFHAVLTEASCSDGFREKAGRAVSMAHARVVQERIASGSSVASQRAVLERGLDYARTWPVLAMPPVAVVLRAGLLQAPVFGVEEWLAAGPAYLGLSAAAGLRWAPAHGHHLQFLAGIRGPSERDLTVFAGIEYARSVVRLVAPPATAAR